MSVRQTIWLIIVALLLVGAGSTYSVLFDHDLLHWALGVAVVGIIMDGIVEATCAIAAAWVQTERTRYRE